MKRPRLQSDSKILHGKQPESALKVLDTKEQGTNSQRRYKMAQKGIILVHESGTKMVKNGTKGQKWHKIAQYLFMKVAQKW